MALYREGKAAMTADGTVTGTGTKWQSSLSLIRPGATIMFLSSPIQMAVVNKVVSDTEIKAITTNGAVVASSDYAILLSDSLTVDGLAQDVAETLRYYQSKETVIADAVEFFKEFDFESLQNLANQIKADSEAAEASSAAAAASESKAKTSEDNAKSSENAAKNSEVAAEATRDQIQQIINDAGDQSTLVVLAQPGGASKINTTLNFTVQQWVDTLGYVTPEMFGDTSDSSVPSEAIWLQAVTFAVANKKKVRGYPKRHYKIGAPIVIPYIGDDFQLMIDGNDCTFLPTGTFSAFNQKNSDGVTVVITTNVSYRRMNIEGVATRKSRWSETTGSQGLSFSNGTAERIYGNGLSNVIRAFGKTDCDRIYGGDNIRNALYSCYAPGNNNLSNYGAVWCAGDGVILKGDGGRIINGHFDYAGCIEADSLDEIDAIEGGHLGTPRGVVLSAGADGAPASNFYISGLTCKYHGAGGVSINGNNIITADGIDVGSIYEDNFVAGKSGAAFGFSVQNSKIGKMYSGKVYQGFGVNAHTNNSFIDKCFIDSKLNIAGSTLISIGDSPTATITNLTWGGMEFNGQSTINDDIYINTDGLRCTGDIYVGALNNQQGGATVNINKAPRIKSMTLVTPTSTAANDNIRINGNAIIDDIYVSGSYGTAVRVTATANPQIKRITLANKQGTRAPIVIEGTTGSESRSIDILRIAPVGGASPTVAGNLRMVAYTGPAWAKFNSSIAASVTFPQPTTIAL